MVSKILRKLEDRNYGGIGKTAKYEILQFSVIIAECIYVNLLHWNYDLVFGIMKRKRTVFVWMFLI